MQYRPHVRIPYNQGPVESLGCRCWRRRFGRRCRRRRRCRFGRLFRRFRRCRRLYGARSWDRRQRHGRRLRDEARRHAEDRQDDDQDEDADDGEDPWARQSVVPGRQRPSISRIAARSLARHLRESVSNCVRLCPSRGSCHEVGQNARCISRSRLDAGLGLLDRSTGCRHPHLLGSHGAHGAHSERPGQECQRADDQQAEDHDRQVENQSHGARRVADRPREAAFTGLRASTAPPDR